MHRYYILPVLAGSLLALCPPVRGDDLTVAIDIETSPVPDLSTITSTYSGEGPTIYAFLVVSGTDSVSGLLTGYSLQGDSSLVSEGFTCLTPWTGAAIDEYGFDPAPTNEVRSSLTALGYWTLQLTQGSNSAGTLSLVPPGGVNGGAILVLDGDHRGLPALVVSHAGINASPPATSYQESAAASLSIPAFHVLASIADNDLVIPPGLVGAPLQAVTVIDSVLSQVLAACDPLRVDKVFPASTPADSVVLTPDGLTVRLPELWHIYKLTMQDTMRIAPLIAALSDTTGVLYAERDDVGERASLTNDPRVDDQWHLQNTGQSGGTPGEDAHVALAWAYGTGTSSAKLAIVDSGIDADHQDLESRSISGDTGYTEAHGTEVTGVAAAATNNGVGIAGMDWHCGLISEIDAPSVETTSAGILSAVSRGADVINVSSSFPTNSTTLRNAVESAFLSGVVLFVCMGNNGAGPYPAAWTEVVTSVGATDNHGDVAYFSNTGSWIDVTAPGVGIWSTSPGDQYASVDGTSFSTPCAAGVGMLILGGPISPTDVDLEQIISRTADDKGDPGFDDTYGWGRVNAGAAMRYVNDMRVEHGSVGSGSVSEHGHTDWYSLSWIFPPYGNPSAVYLVRRYDMRTTIQFPHSYLAAPDLWVRRAGTAGLSDANPQAYDWPWGRVLSQGSTEATLQTFVYEVRSYPFGTPIGWWPVEPSEVTFAYTIAGIPATTDVEEAKGPGSLELVVKGGNPIASAGIEFLVRAPRAGEALIDLLDPSGRVVQAIRHCPVSRGTSTLAWDATIAAGADAASGVYFIRLTMPGVGSVARKVSLIR